MQTSGYAMVVHGRPKPLKYKFLGSPSPQGSYSPHTLGDTTRHGHVTCPSLIQIGSKTAEKNSAQTNRQTNRHYETNGHFATNQNSFWLLKCLCSDWNQDNWMPSRFHQVQPDREKSREVKPRSCGSETQRRADVEESHARLPECSLTST